MKHVFGVASHLVFYLCNKIIEIDSINPDDCIFFFMRNYHCPEKFNETYKHQIHFESESNSKYSRVFAGLNIKKTKQNIRDFDELVDAYIKGEDFYWYKTKDWLSGNVKIGGIEVDETTIQDIDTETDWRLAEMKYKLININ